MTLEELITEFRIVSGDGRVPYLWSDAALTVWANEAEREACRRAPLLVDSRGDVSTVTAPADDPYIEYDSAIIAIRRAKVASQSSPLALMTVQEMDKERPGWEDDTSSELEALVVDTNSGALRAYPTPTAAVEITLTVQRLPAAEMEDVSDEPEIRPGYHLRLVDWMLYRAYSVDDIDKGDPDKATKHLTIFANEFGTSTARIETFFLGIGQHVWSGGVR